MILQVLYRLFLHYLQFHGIWTHFNSSSTSYSDEKSPDTPLWEASSALTPSIPSPLLAVLKFGLVFQVRSAFMILKRGRIRFPSIISKTILPLIYLHYIGIYLRILIAITQNPSHFGPYCYLGRHPALSESSIPLPELL